MIRLALLVLPTALPAFELALPVDCALGETCHVQQGFDHDAGPGARDASCGTLAYDGHDGTDVALPTLADQARGVDVVAAAAGTVTGVRDEMEDRPQGTEGAPDVAGRECGNGVVVAHEGGWETQYCHMARGSVTVGPGDAVAAGDVLGRVGLSGNTEFPHLHLSVRRDGVAVDPFAPDGATCGETARDLWAGDVPFPPGGVTDAGFATAVPGWDAVRAGAADEAPARDAPLVLFALLYGGRDGDVVRLTFEGPDGEAFAHEEVLGRTQALLFRAAGRRAPEGGWPPGAYAGTATLLRDGEVVDAIEAGVAVP